MVLDHVHDVRTAFGQGSASAHERLGHVRLDLDLPGLRVEITEVNGAAAVVAWVDGEPLMSLSLVVTDGLVGQILLVRNPDKLGAVGTEVGLGR